MTSPDSRPHRRRRVRSQNPPAPIVILAGDIGSGKTTLARRLVSSEFALGDTGRLDEYELRGADASGMESRARLIETRDPTTLPSGLPKELLSCVVVVCDATNGQDLAHALRRWTEKFTSIGALRDVPRLAAVWSDQEVVGASASPDYHGILSIDASSGRGLDQLRREMFGLSVRRNRTLSPIQAAVVNLSRTFCEILAEDPSAIWEMEWRQLEAVVATAFAGLGFTATLTPSSKDGGKDVVLEATVAQAHLTYYVEVKHWRGSRVGKGKIVDFIEVNAWDRTSGGLFLSTSGFTHSVCASVAEFSKCRVQLGSEEKIVSLCRRFVSSQGALLAPDGLVPDILFSHTL